MINRQALLSDLQALLKHLEADLLERSESTEILDVGETLRGEYDRAKKAERTAQNYEDWRSDAITQAAAAWVLSCVFVRFLEDNQLIDPPKIAGPDERLQQARDEHTLYFQDSERARLTDREYLLAVFDELAKLPGTKDVFGKHNPIRELPNWLSGDAAGELLRFFQKIDANTGELLHNFTDTEWETRFLGDLYQDLSEAARKKYALLQTPEFVEEFILDRTLDPALDEFGLEPESGETSAMSSQRSAVSGQNEKADSRSLNADRFKMIDPACGSGHFLLGAFPRILDRWQKQEPGGKIRDLVQKTLDCIHGVDVNPYAVAIARFRLLLMAMKACGVTQLADAPAFHFNLACGDSLLHAPLRGGQQVFAWELTSEDSECDHAYQSEDLAKLKRMLRSGIYHAVVANPPYITPKDRQLNQRYRKRFESCHMKYSLAVPFMERIFRMAIEDGFAGQITANSFMKREFGKKLIEEFLPKVDVTHVIDTSLAYIPGHGTPTLIMFGRNRKPVCTSIRCVGGIQREDNEPEDPSHGLYWTAVLDQLDSPGSESTYVSVSDTERARLHSHPWSIGGGGAAELKEWLDKHAQNTLSRLADSMGITSFTLEDDIYLVPESAARRSRISKSHYREMVVGDAVRDWSQQRCSVSVFPYGEDFEPGEESPSDPAQRFLWLARTCLANNKMFGGKTKVEAGLKWYEYGRLTSDKLRTPLSIVFAFVATHNHFVLDRGGKVFNRSAPVIKLASGSDEKDHLIILGILNGSVAAFWLRQACHDKGGGGIGGGIAAEAWERFFEYTGTKLLDFPLPHSTSPILRLARRLDCLASKCSEDTPETLLKLGVPMDSHKSLRQQLETARNRWCNNRGLMIFLQEELDWTCYKLFGLIEEDLTYEGDPLPMELGERSFEILLARGVGRGSVPPTTWFERHGATPKTELPEYWPDDYKSLYHRRHDIQQSNRDIRLIEQPENKRRWNTEPWESQLERALREWLLNRLETYFDFDGRMNDGGQPTAKLDIVLTTVAKLADVARQDLQFMEVGEVYRDDAAFDVQRLVEELVKGDHVPLLPVLRYKPSGLRKRQEWEKTWELQRQEDALSEQLSAISDQLEETSDEGERKRLAAEQEKLMADSRELTASIPVPPKYKSSDFISTGGARYWALRGKLDVPKERWVSFPHCEGPDGTLVIAWAGYDHLQLARAISAYFVDIQERLGGRDDPRLVPLLACIIELLPWLKQWHHDIDPDYNQRMDEVFEGFVTEEAKNLGMTIDEIKSWQPPKKSRRKTRKKSQ